MFVHVLRVYQQCKRERKRRERVYDSDGMIYDIFARRRQLILIESMSEKKERRRRSVFDIEQIRHLEHVFNHFTHYPDSTLRRHLTELTHLTEKNIQVLSSRLATRLSFSFFRSGFKIVELNGVNNINSVISVVSIN